MAIIGEMKKLTVGNKTYTLPSGGSSDIGIFCGTCSTSADTTAKVVTLDDATGFTLTDGVRLAVTFTSGNTATSPTLNVNNLGAKGVGIYANNNSVITSNAAFTSWGGKETVLFTYNGTRWIYNTSGSALYKAYTNANNYQGTVTSVGVSNATNGGLSVSGSPVTSSGTITVGHSNVLSSAQTTQAVYPIKIDKNGHISEYGSAVTSMPASDVSAWAKASTKPTYTATEVGALPSTTAIPTKTSDLTNDSGFITGYTETDPTVPSWAKQSSKPSYTASEVGAVPTSRTVNGKALSSNITLSASDVSALPASTSIPTKTSDLTNDSGYITGYTETDPTVPSWAKASTKPSYTASEVGAVSKTNGYATDSEILSAATIAAWNAIFG